MDRFIRNVVLSAAIAAPALVAVAETVQAQTGPYMVTVWNNNDLVITDLYVSSANSSRWGRDRLGSGELEQDGSVEIPITTRSGNCLYDVKAVYEDDSYDQVQVDICYDGSIEFFGYGGDYR